MHLYAKLRGGLFAQRNEFGIFQVLGGLQKGFVVVVVVLVDLALVL